jgi:hypothetical protein
MILCVGMLGLATVILVIATVASAFVAVPVVDWDSTARGPVAGGAVRAGERQYPAAV